MLVYTRVVTTGVTVFVGVGDFVGVRVADGKGLTLLQEESAVPVRYRHGSGLGVGEIVTDGVTFGVAVVLAVGDAYAPLCANCRISPVRSFWTLAMMKNVLPANNINSTSGNIWANPFVS